MCANVFVKSDEVSCIKRNIIIIIIIIYLLLSLLLLFIVYCNAYFLMKK